MKMKFAVFSRTAHAAAPPPSCRCQCQCQRQRHPSERGRGCCSIRFTPKIRSARPRSRMLAARARTEPPEPRSSNLESERGRCAAGGVLSLLSSPAAVNNKPTYQPDEPACSRPAAPRLQPVYLLLLVARARLQKGSGSR